MKLNYIFFFLNWYVTMDSRWNLIPQLHHPPCSYIERSCHLNLKCVTFRFVNVSCTAECRWAVSGENLNLTLVIIGGETQNDFYEHTWLNFLYDWWSILVAYFIGWRLKGVGRFGSRIKGFGFNMWTLVATFIVMTRNTPALLEDSKRWEQGIASCFFFGQLTVFRIILLA